MAEVTDVSNTYPLVVSRPALDVADLPEPEEVFGVRKIGARELFMTAPFVLGASDEVTSLALQGGIAVDAADVLAASAAGTTGVMDKRSAVMAGAVALAAVGLGIYACMEE